MTVIRASLLARKQLTPYLVLRTYCHKSVNAAHIAKTSAITPDQRPRPFSREQLEEAYKDQIRWILHNTKKDVVEEVIEARRGIWGEQPGGDKRKQNDEEQARKRQRMMERGDGKGGLPVYATKFTEEEVKAEDRRPKKKVAVMIGYSGTGYKGMQLAHDQKTIEGDLFKAFVAAGAVSKANADDPKKSSFVRCARTDKGVHAAGNVISLKLIIEDEDIVKKINDNLTSQIRVWGFERTINSFSAYQMVDSRIYEYLIPTHSFLPPHPSSFMGRKCLEWAEKKGNVEQWKTRQQEVEGFWEKFDEEVIKPILAEYDSDVRTVLEKALYLKPEDDVSSKEEDVTVVHTNIGNDSHADDVNGTNKQKAGLQQGGDKSVTESSNEMQEAVEAVTSQAVTDQIDPVGLSTDDLQNEQQENAVVENQEKEKGSKRARAATIADGVKRLRAAYIQAKRAYRIPPSRLARVRESLDLYTGTKNYHNYTIEKAFKDPSAKRVIKSFVVDADPININGTEWLSLKVHGQSFMMHQIRKMVGMVALVVRCGCDPQRIVESYGKDKISIPKAPSLGLLLERPVFDSYNKRAIDDHGKETIGFDKYKIEMDAFKQREIYERMYSDEEKDNVFGNFFNHVDNFPSETFLFVTSGGVEATKVADIEGRDAASKQKIYMAKKAGLDDDDEDDSDVDAVKDDAGNEG